VSQVILASAGLSDQTGLAYQQRLFWADVAGMWVMPVIVSGTLNQLRFYSNSSPDFTQGTWSQLSGSPVTLAQSLVGGGSNWSVSYFYGSEPSDIFHGIYGNKPGANPTANYLRGYFSGGAVTLTHDVNLNTATFLTGTPTAPYGCNVYVGQDAKIAHTIANGPANGWYGITWSASDSGVLSGWSEVGIDTWNFQSNAGQTTNINGIGIFGGITTSSGIAFTEGADDTDPNSMKTVRYATNSRSGAGSFGTDTDVGFSALGAGVDPNNFGAVNRTNLTAEGTDIHCVFRTGSNTFSHRRYNGSSWSAGSSIPNQNSKAAAGLAMCSDGVSVWLFIIDSDTNNTVRYIRWNGTAWDATWTALELSNKTRNNISCSRRIDGYAIGLGLFHHPIAPRIIGVCWTETNGGTFDIVGTTVDVSSIYAGVGAQPPPRQGGWATRSGGMQLGGTLLA